MDKNANNHNNNKSIIDMDKYAQIYCKGTTDMNKCSKQQIRHQWHMDLQKCIADT
jgi:uncharacterized protein